MKACQLQVSYSQKLQVASYAQLNHVDMAIIQFFIYFLCVWLLLFFIFLFLCVCVWEIKFYYTQLP